MSSSLRGIAIATILATMSPYAAAQQTSPGPRAGAHMVFDPTLRELVLFGGASGEDFPDDLWAWNGKQWRMIAPERPLKPPGRGEPNLVYDGGRRRLVLFGGRRRTPGVTSLLRGDLWEWDGRTWTEIHTPSFPVLHGTAIYDPDGKQVANFGGIDESGVSQKLSGWNGSSWREVDHTGPASLAVAAAAIGGELHFVVCQSGRSSDQVPALTWKWNGKAWSRGEEGPPITSLQASASAPDGTIYIYQTQEWLDRPVLHVRTPAGVWRSRSFPVQPPGRIGAAAAYDPLRKVFVIFGGSKGGQTFGDTWEFDGERWTSK